MTSSRAILALAALALTATALLCCAASVAAAAADEPVKASHPAADDGSSDDDDAHKFHTTVRDGMDSEDVRLAGHLAYYVLASIIRFPDMKTAMDKIADIKSGVTNFKQVAEDMNHVFMLAGERRQSSGEVGLIKFGDIELPLAKLLFDIRNPEAEENDMHLVGPVVTQTGVMVGTAFKRYRKQFFSQAWWELETFCNQAKMKVSDMMQLIENQDKMWQMSFMIWPEEHVSFKRLKIRQVRADFKNIGGDDPSTRMPPPKKKLEPHLHRARIDERINFFKKVDPRIIEAHPEIYAMTYEQIRAHGWHPEDAAVKRAKERYASESKSEAEQQQEREADRSLRAG